MSWSALSPANIALIKYMGKIKSPSLENKSNINLCKNLPSRLTQHLDEEDKKQIDYKNQAINPSLSYTLNHFLTKVEIRPAEKDSWQAFEQEPDIPLLYESSKKITIQKDLSPQAQKKFLDFFDFLKRVFSISGHYILISQNNFPMAVGSASSASSFSALTLATYKLAQSQSAFKEKLSSLSLKHLAYLSRIGSGSSCRSFFSPWALWGNQTIEKFSTPWNKLLHQLVVINDKEKKVSSTKAHEKVCTSPYFKEREKRALQRMQSLQLAFKEKNWKKCFQISCAEFEDLHTLFETAKPSLKYKTSSSEEVINTVKDYWNQKEDGPLITMDAGASVHLLYRPDQQKLKEDISHLLKDYILLSSL